MYEKDALLIHARSERLLSFFLSSISCGRFTKELEKVSEAGDFDYIALQHIEIKP